MQISIITVIDVAAALKEGTLEGNAYVIDNTASFAPPSGPEPRVTNVPGVYKPDGSQAAEAVLNWITVGVASPPTTLPRNYHHRFNAANRGRRLIADLHAARTPGAVSKLLEDPEGGVQRLPRPMLVRHHGAVRARDAVVLSASGDVLEHHTSTAAASVPPLVTGVGGPAVEQGVLYPALYGSPDLQTDGWYWSASVDTGKLGRHDYTLEVALYEPVQVEGETVWEPRLFTLACGVWVGSLLGVNGFTGCPAPSLLPIPPASFTAAAGDTI